MPGNSENCAGKNVLNAARPQPPTKRPTPPPMIDMTRLSVSSCWTICPRVAPTARRTDSSFCRTAALARRRVATFAQAMSRTQPTAPSSSSSAARTSPTQSSRIRRRLGPCPVFSSGYAFDSRLPMTFSSSRAACSDTPGRRRPMTERKCAARSCRSWSSRASGTSTSDGEGHQNLGESTPTTSYGFPSKVTVRPTMSGAAPKLRRQNASVSRTTRCRPYDSSLSWKFRPIAGGSPSASRKPAETLSVRMRSGSPVPVRFTAPSLNAAIAAKLVASRRQSKKSAGDTAP